ncbi:MAG: MFS transporter [Saccharolobus sp.]
MWGPTANYPLLQAYVADNVSEVERGKAYGILSAALGSGFVVGPAIGGLLSS